MEGIPILEIAQKLGISSEAVKMRFHRRGIKPIRYIGSAGLYRESDIDIIRDAFQGNHKKKESTKPSSDTK
jgi:Zn-dependent peptidase ImmA (M78 family)